MTQNPGPPDRHQQPRIQWGSDSQDTPGQRPSAYESGSYGSAGSYDSASSYGSAGSYGSASQPDFGDAYRSDASTDPATQPGSYGSASSYESASSYGSASSAGSYGSGQSVQEFPSYESYGGVGNPYGMPTNQGGLTPYGAPASYGFVETAPQATAALVLGILSWFILITGPIALGLGIGSLRKINNEPTRYTGKGMAVAGIVLGGLTTLFLVFLLFVVIVGFAAS